MSYSEADDKDLDNKQAASDAESENYGNRGELQSRKPSATVWQDDSSLLVQMEAITRQNCADQELKGKQTAKKFGFVSAPTRTKTELLNDTRAKLWYRHQSW